MKRKKVIFTGGHPAPALAVIDRLIEMDKEKNIQIVFVGKKYNGDEKSLSFEYKEITARKIPFIVLETGRSTRFLSIKSIINLLKIPFGMYSAWSIISREKPDLLMSFGGYLAYPLAKSANIQKIPVFTHEQTIHPGLANKNISNIAQKIFISFPQSAKFFNSKNIILTGNPIRQGLLKTKKTLHFDEDIPVIYVTGGSLGAHSVNILIEKIFKKLLESYIVVHQTGSVSEYGDYERLLKLRENLSENLKKRYILKQHFDTNEVGQIFAKSALVIGRSGANTFFELLAFSKKSILIPLPIAAFDEQSKQAKYLEDIGVAKVFDQKDTPENLYNLVKDFINEDIDLEKRYEKIRKNFPEDAAEKIAREISDALFK